MYKAKTEHQLQKEKLIINSVMSVAMTISAIVYMFVLNYYLPMDSTVWNRTLCSVPSILLQVMAMWIIVKPEDVEF
jgi:hypothetical protein